MPRIPVSTDTAKADRQASIDIAAGASPQATLECIGAFARTDFRDDLTKISVPTLVIHEFNRRLLEFLRS